jgi:hypothetical protein
MGTVFENPKMPCDRRKRYDSPLFIFFLGTSEQLKSSTSSGGNQEDLPLFFAVPTLNNMTCQKEKRKKGNKCTNALAELARK